ncbi:MAG: helix-turn-helix transcriptional regulator [Gammaproteobacteria bacterium]
MSEAIPIPVAERTPDAETLLLALGERVRRVRTQRGMTRRALAEQSQVSERYLAQLEGGQGNASVRVLQRIATALGSALADLLDTAPSRPVEYTLLVETLKTLPAPMLARLRQQVLRDVGAARTAETPRIALVGLRGAGKSTLGARLAGHFEVPFIELDREIERRSGAPLEELFLLYGQAAYRRHELKCLSQVIDEYPACVVATGGSLVSEPAAYALLLSACVTVWLRATPAEHMARVIAQGDLRPMAGNAEAMADLERILDERAPLYARADCVVDTSGRDEDAAFHALIDALHSVSAQEKNR